MYVCMYVCMYVSMYLCMYVCIIIVCLFVCVLPVGSRGFDLKKTGEVKKNKSNKYRTNLDNNSPLPHVYVTIIDITRNREQKCQGIIMSL